MDEGTGSEIMLPNTEIFASHFEESRGSNVSAAADQYLQEDEMKLIVDK